MGINLSVVLTNPVTKRRLLYWFGSCAAGRLSKHSKGRGGVSFSKRPLFLNPSTLDFMFWWSVGECLVLPSLPLPFLSLPFFFSFYSPLAFLSLAPPLPFSVLSPFSQWIFFFSIFISLLPLSPYSLLAFSSPSSSAHFYHNGFPFHSFSFTSLQWCLCVPFSVAFPYTFVWH